MAGQSVREIRRRIVSVQNTQQITRAMEMVSAAKLRRSQNQVVAGRPFADKLREVLGRLTEAQRSKNDEEASAPTHPLLEVRDVDRVLYVVVTADRGLAGGYSANVNRFFLNMVQSDGERDPNFDVIVIGRKGKEFLEKNEINPVDEHLYIGDDIEYEMAQSMARQLMEFYSEGTYDEIHFVYSQFISAATQRPTSVQLLPLTHMVEPSEEETPAPDDVSDEDSDPADEEDHVDEYIYEPDADTVLNTILPRFVNVEVYRILVEAKASEHGARMTAMKAATDNAEDMIDQLTLNYNRARQAGITKEISEIVGGAEAIAAD